MAEKKTPLDTALDLKAKALKVAVECSDLASFLNRSIEGIMQFNTLQSKKDELKEVNEAQEEAIKKSLETHKNQLNKDREEFEAYKSKELKQIAETKQITVANYAQMKSKLEAIAKQFLELENERTSFDQKRRDLEERHAKIAELTKGK